MRRRRLVPLAALVAVLAGGCTSGRAETSPAIRAAPGTIPTPAARVESFALDRFMMRPAQANDLDTMVKRLTRACMLRRGEDWRGGERNDFDLLRDRSHRFGLDDEQLAASAGYHWDTVPGSPPGRGLDDCSGAAHRELGWADGEFRWLGQLAGQAIQQTYADPRARLVTKRWSECMEQAGFRYAGPLDAEADPRWGPTERPHADERATAEAGPRWGPTERPHADERATAVADTRCKAQVRYAEQLGHVLAEKQVDAVRDNVHRLEAFRRMAAAAATRADTLRGDHRPPPPDRSGSAVPPGNWRAEHVPA